MTHIIKRSQYGVLDLFGPTIEFMTLPDETDAIYCAMIGTIPAGGSVPLHSHSDVESFFTIAGEVQVLSQRGDSLEWLDARAGDFVHIPAGSKHAFRNTSNSPVVQLITTTPRLGKFFQEIGRPISPGKPAPPPTADDLHRFAQLSAKYGYWLGSPEENAAIGISINPPAPQPPAAGPLA